jgi:hypothetical protein
VPTGATAATIGTGDAASRTGDFAIMAAMHWEWTLPSGLTWLFIAGCAVVAWLIGYGTGYRRGVNDAINGSSARKPDHQLNED